MGNPIKLSKKYLQQTFVLQLEQSDCGIACLLSIIQYYEGSNSFEELRELSGTTKQGTTLLGLFQAANSMGFTATGNQADIQALIDHKKPLILHVTIDERLQHYVVCYGYVNGKFIIGDPAKGISSYDKEELNCIWKSKSCLTFTPNENFIKEKTRLIDKKQWFLSILKEDYKLIGFSIFLGIGIVILGMTMAIFSQKLIDEILPSKDIDKLIIGLVWLPFYF